MTPGQRQPERTEAETALASISSTFDAVPPDLQRYTSRAWELAYAQALHDGRIALATRVDLAKHLALYIGRDR